jgi:fructose-bisphosphate aldolase/6-deoxy-5-ketofructose 1-phosphate synthase
MEKQKTISSNPVHIPADVPAAKRDTYIENFTAATAGSGRMMLFAGDQKIEHLNDDFVGPQASAESADPKHLFEIASKAKITVFASQLGTIARYGGDYPTIPYLVKLNSKTDIVPTTQRDPLSLAMNTVDQVVRFKESSGLNILGVGYTLYLGSEYENEMMAELGRIIFEAHQQGLITLVWMYPRGKAVSNERDPHLIAGAAGVACCIGTDFVKVNFPKVAETSDPKKRAELFLEATRAAGTTHVICSGGEKMPVQDFLQQLWDQIHIGGAKGNATGRNIHERSLEEAIRFCNAIYAITIEDKSVAEAMHIYNDIANDSNVPNDLRA